MANRVYGYQGYNKGYQFETSPKKLQPEYKPSEFEQKKEIKKDQNKKAKTQQTKTATTAKVISKAEFSKKTKLVCYIIFGFAVLFTISYRNSIINEKFNEKESLKNELAEIQKVNEQLEVSVENELNLTSVEKLAKEKLGMSKLSNNQKIYISLPKEEYVETKTESLLTQNETNGFQKIINKITNFIK